MKNLLALLFLFLIAFAGIKTAEAQNPLVKQWDYRFGGNSIDLIYGLEQTIDGGFILGGYSYSDSSGDKTQQNWGWSDYWIVKMDSSGNKQWDKRFGGINEDKLFSLQQTFDGGYILGGYSESDSSGDKTQPSRGFKDYWIVKTDSLGVKKWDKRFGGIGQDILVSLQHTNDEGYILGGYSYSDSSGDKSQNRWGGYGDFWIIKMDSLGNKQWDKDFGGYFEDDFSSLQQTSDGGYILGGFSRSSIGGDKTEPNWDTTLYTSDYWIIKIDSIGNKQWDKRFGGKGEDHLYSLKQTFDGGYILGGISESGISGDKSQDTIGAFDYWIVKTDSLGNKQWDKDFGGLSDEDFIGNISQTADGGYLIAGVSYSNSGGDKSEDNLGEEQTWVIKAYSNGTKQWDKTIFTIGHDEEGYAIQTDDYCYVMAVENATGIGGYRTQATQGGPDYWIIKFCDSTLTTTVPIINHNSSAINIYPNPASQYTVISIQSPINKEIEIIITDVLGQIVFTKTVESPTSNFQLKTSGFPSGIYFVRAGNAVGKFVKQ